MSVIDDRCSGQPGCALIEAQVQCGPPAQKRTLPTRNGSTRRAVEWVLLIGLVYPLTEEDGWRIGVGSDDSAAATRRR